MSQYSWIAFTDSYGMLTTISTADYHAAAERRASWRDQPWSFDDGRDFRLCRAYEDAVRRHEAGLGDTEEAAIADLRDPIAVAKRADAQRDLDEIERDLR